LSTDFKIKVNGNKFQENPTSRR